MPELPEVETIRQDLRQKILNKKIVHVEVYAKKSVGGANKKFIQALEGNTITEIERRGKLMIFRLRHTPVISNPRRRGEKSSSHSGQLDSSSASGLARNDKTASVAVLVHLKMTGQLIYEKETKHKVEIVAGGHKMTEQDIDALPNKHTRIAFVFEDGGELFFNDLRLFGYMKLVSTDEVGTVVKKFGPEPGDHDFTFEYFTSLFARHKKTTLKAMLLNQELIAGLGNIYVDEVCYCAGVRPNRRVGSITKAEQKKIFGCIPKIIAEALRHRGTTFRNFLDSSGKKGNYTDFLRVYDRAGKPCKKCGHLILKTRAAGRGTHYCTVCQK